MRDAPSGQRGAPDRVRRSHRQTRLTLSLAAGFIAAAAISVMLGASRWLALHLFLAGGVVLAISGVSVMLAVTWSAAPAPRDGVVALQRVLIAAAVIGVAVGREAGHHALLVTSGSAYLAGLALLGFVLLHTITRGVERRFDPAVAGYVGALVAGVVAIGIGIRIGAGGASVPLRGAHVTLNLLGLVGLVVAATLPYFSATVGRSRMAPRATRLRLVGLLVVYAAALVIAALGLATDHTGGAAVGLGLYATAIAGTVALLPSPTRRQLDWAGPRLVALWLGAGWWIVAVVASAVDAARGDTLVFGGRWLLVTVVGGYAQILWGSLAYLVPMLRGGGHQLLSAGFAATRSWVGLAAANVAAIALVARAGELATAAGAVWVADTAWRAGRAATSGRRSQAPLPEGGTA